MISDAPTPVRGRPYRPLSWPFLAFFAVAFLAIGAGLGALALLHLRGHLHAAEVTGSLERTLELNQSMRQGLSEQFRLLHAVVREGKLADYERFRRAAAELSDQQSAYLGLEIESPERIVVANVKMLHSELDVRAARVYELVMAGDRAGAERAQAGSEEIRARLDQTLDQLGRMQLAKIQQAIQTAADSRPGAELWMFAAASVLCMVGGFMLLLRRRVLAPLGGMLRAAARMRGGDYAARAPVTRRDEIGRLAAEFNFMAAALEGEHGRLERKVAERAHALRELQGQLVQAEKMSAVGQLVGGVAHELNNPLTAIMGYAELATHGLEAANPDSPELRKLAVILEQSHRCRRIVADLLQFARQRDTHLERIGLHEVVRRAVRLREYELSTRDVHVRCKMVGPNPVVLADAFKVQQVVLVLLNNAVDAILERGESGNVWIEVRIDGEQAVLEVSDDGTGIADASRVFDPFYTTKEVGKGTGLGLSVCYGIVNEHDGEIRAENWEKGARFEVRLPVVEQREAGEVAESVGVMPDGGVDVSGGVGGAGAGAGGGATSRDLSHGSYSPEASRLRPRALVVDDEAWLIDLQMNILQRIGLDASGAHDGEEAIRYLEQRPFDLVVSDIRMPGTVDGVSLYHWVRDNRPELATRFVFTTGDPAAAKDHGAVCIAKPFGFEDYARVVRGMLAGREVGG